MEQMVGLDQAT